jgi:hypothetical protein
MPTFQNEDLAFRAPSGSSVDDARIAFERTDARIKRALSSITTYSSEVNSSLTDLGNSVGVLTASLSSVQASLTSSIAAVDTDLQGYKAAFSTRFAASFSSSFGTAMGSVFTTASNPGFAQVTELGAAAGDFIMVGTSTKIPRWQTKANFVKHTVGLETPLAYAAHGYNVSNEGSMWPNNNNTATQADVRVLAFHFDGHVNAINAAIFNLVAALKSAKVFV